MDDFRRTDEDHLEWRFAECAFVRIAGSVAGGDLPFDKLALANGAVDLASVGIAADADVERAEARLLRILHFCREQNRACTRAESRLGFHELLQFLESGVSEEFKKCPRLASGNDEPI